MGKSLALYAALCSNVAIAQQTPTQAFVVNTGDGTVSQVDLQNKKESERSKSAQGRTGSS